MITHSDSIKAISKALLAFQGAVDGVEKNKANPHFKSRYANLEAVRDTAVPELQKVGIVYVQSPGPIVDGNMSLTTMLIHPESGEWMKMTGDIALGKRDPQGVGSALTYLQRYSLMAALGLPPVDDDGEAAMERKPAPARKPVAAESNNPAPEQPSLYKRLSVANSACGDKAAFNALWGNPATIKAQSSLSVNESTWLEKEKAKKFAELEVNEPSDYVPPSFDDLPEPTQQAVKNLGA